MAKYLFFQPARAVYGQRFCKGVEEIQRPSFCPNEFSSDKEANEWARWVFGPQAFAAQMTEEEVKTRTFNFPKFDGQSQGSGKSPGVRPEKSGKRPAKFK